MCHFICRYISVYLQWIAGILDINTERLALRQRRVAAEAIPNHLQAQAQAQAEAVKANWSKYDDQVLVVLDTHNGTALNGLAAPPSPNAQHCVIQYEDKIGISAMDSNRHHEKVKMRIAAHGASPLPANQEQVATPTAER